MTLRNEKVRKAMMREISQILLTEIQDTRISTLVSIADVVMAHDNSFAKIYFSILEENEDEKNFWAVFMPAYCVFIGSLFFG